MKSNNLLKDKFTVVVWLFEAQYQIASQIEGVAKFQTKHVFNRFWREVKSMAKHLNIAYRDLEQEKNIAQDLASDDMFESGAAVLEFCEAYMQAEQDGRQDEFMNYINNFK